MNAKVRFEALGAGSALWRGWHSRMGRPETTRPVDAAGAASAAAPAPASGAPPSSVLGAVAGVKAPRQTNVTSAGRSRSRDGRIVGCDVHDPARTVIEAQRTACRAEAFLIAAPRWET